MSLKSAKLLADTVAVAALAVVVLTGTRHTIGPGDPKPTAAAPTHTFSASPQPSSGSGSPEVSSGSGSTTTDSGSDITERLVGYPMASNGGITITVTRVAEEPGANERATRVEVVIINETDAQIKVPLEFDGCAFNDNDGNSLPASDFYTNSEWRGTVPAHAFRRAAVTFERTVPAKATTAELVLTLQPVSGLGVDSLVITVRGIQLRSL